MNLEPFSLQVRNHLGIHLGPQKNYLLASRLGRLQASEGVEDLAEFLKALERGDLGAIDALSRHVTTNHTFFFREPQHFLALRDELRRENAVAPRIWSAAGSTGEEAYSLAMVLTDSGISDFRILVTDVNRSVLAQGVAGTYDQARLERVPDDWVTRYFTRESGGQFRVRKDLRDRLRFRHLNLSQAWDLDMPLDAILCRNVLIYFDPVTVSEVLDRLVASLRPGGWLFLGMTEGAFHPPGTIRRGPAMFQKEAP